MNPLQDGALEEQDGGYIGGGAVSNNGTSVSNYVHTNLAGTQEKRICVWTRWKCIWARSRTEADFMEDNQEKAHY